MSVNYYEMAVQLIGELPETSLWIYDCMTIFLIISAFCLLLIPISLVLKRVLSF